MVQRLLHISLATVALLIIANVCLNSPQEAQAAKRKSPDLFYNFYVPPCGWGGAGAQLYLCPRPTPPMVGHTYVTYQPLMPHEFLYRHCRSYYRKNPGAGWTRTKVWWQ